MRRRPWMMFSIALLASGLRADEGRIPIYKPTTITQPGHYILTRDVTAATGPALDVNVGTVGHIGIDLNGHIISTLDSSAPVIEINLLPAVQAAIRVSNGSIAGGLHGVSLLDADWNEQLVLRDLSISGSASHGVFVNGAASVNAGEVAIMSTGLDGIHVENVLLLNNKYAEISGAGGVGVYAGPAGLAGASVQLHETHVRQTASHGIQYLGGQEGEDVVLENSSIIDAGGNGFDAASLGGATPGLIRLQSNRILGTDGHGVRLDGVYQAQILDNQIADIGRSGGPDMAGFLGWNDNKIVGNALQGGGGASSHGIRLMPGADGSLIERNNVSGFRTGVTMESSGNLALSNTIHDNTGIGMARKHIQVDPGSGSLLAQNVINNNGLDGIKIEPGNLGNLILENQLRGNGGLGLAAGDPSNNYRGNMLLGNSGGSVGGGTDAGGNIVGP